MRMVLVLVTMVACHSDGPGLCAGTIWCEGDQLMRCRSTCEGEVNCSRDVSVARDCAAEGEALGVAQTCGEITTGNNSEVESCIDAERIPCNGATGGALFCSPAVPSLFRTCQATPDGSFWQTYEYTRCEGGQICHPARQGVFCYTPPGEPCTEGPQYCDPDGKTLVQCKGTPDAGFILARTTCTGTCGLHSSGTYQCLST